MLELVHAFRDELRRLHEGLRDAKMVIFEESAHAAHIEEPEAYAELVSQFLAQIDV